MKPRDLVAFGLGVLSTTCAALVLVVLLSARCIAAEPPVSSGFFTTSDGVRLHYLEGGQGPALVFVPGWTMPAEIWEPQIRHFSAKYRVVALDPRSQGESERPTEGHYAERRAQDIKELLDHLKLRDAVLVGWSLSVAEVLVYTRDFGTERLRGLVLVDATLSDPDKATVERTRAFFAWLKTMQTDRLKWTRDFVRNMYAKPLPEAYLDRITAFALRTPTNSAFALLANMQSQPDWRPAMAKIDKPVIYICQTALKGSADLVKAALPAARIEILDGVGHAMFVDDPERFNGLVESFLNSLPAAPAERQH